MYHYLNREPEQIFEKLQINDEHKEKLLATLHRKLTTNPFKIRVDFLLTCTGYDGVEAIREALLTAKHEVNDETWQLEFKMIAPPHYKCEVVTHNRSEGENKLIQALSIIKRVIKQNGGTFAQEKDKKSPYVIGANADEQGVEELLDKFHGNGDESSDEESNEEGMGNIDLNENTGV